MSGQGIPLVLVLVLKIVVLEVGATAQLVCHHLLQGLNLHDLQQGSPKLT